jgi:glycosyltransferase involved in cell wall biosynthesis
MALWEQHHGAFLPASRRVIHNATRPDRQVQRQPSEEVRVLYAGSPRDYKGLQKVFDSLPLWPAGVRLVLVGGAPAGTPNHVEVQPGVDYQKLPAVLATAHALLLPLEDNLFGRQLTSPLKLWDYLATGIPMVAANLPTVRAIAGDLPCYYDPQVPTSIAAAVARALAMGESPRRLRFWEERAAEVEEFLMDLPR